MFTTKTKMLFNQLPGMMVYDNEHEIWTRATDWSGDTFRPATGVDNTEYLKARAITFIQSHPEHLRLNFPSLDAPNFVIEQPRSVNLRIFPRLFECLKCGRAKSFRDQENGNPASYTGGFYCSHCKNRSRFRQWNLMFTHQCGVVASPQLQPCRLHKYEHLYLSILGGQRAGDIRVRCMGPDGSRSSPACDILNEDLMPDAAQHSRSGCPTATRLKKQFVGNVAATEVAQHLLERGPQIRTVKDPVNYRTVGIDLVAPNIQVPPNIDGNERALTDLLRAHLEGRRLTQADFHRIVEAGTGESPRIKALERAILAFQEAVGDAEGLSPAMRSKFWKMGNAAGAIADYPADPEQATDEISKARDRGAGAGGLLGSRPTDDRRQLADQLIEIGHLNSEASGFTGLDETLAKLQERGRPFSEEFEAAAREIRSLGFDDIEMGEAFNIVRMQVGFGRATYEPEFSILNPFTTPSADTRLRLYGRQTQTEAILFRLDATKFVRWVHEALPNEDFERLSEKDQNSRAKCLEWLVKICDFSLFGAIEPIQRQPSKLIYEAVHTMSHAFMKTCASFTGIDEANVKELIFPALPGFVLYKSQHGDFNLGGFVSLYEQHLGEWVARARRQVATCHNDPICRNARMRDNTNAAACYGCMTGSEHSCAHYNRNLDRATLVSTVIQRTGPQLTGFWRWNGWPGHD